MKAILKLLKEVATFALHVALFYIAYKMVAPLIVACLIAVWYKYGSVKGYFLNSASSLDRWGNSEFKTLWNLILIKSSSLYKFGNIFETISSVLGKNERASQVVLVNYRVYYWWKKYKVYRHRKFIKTDYTLIGIGLNRFLWMCDYNHCMKSINDKIT